jgi:hypothetical protein
MLTVIFSILSFVVFGKILIFALKAAWSISKIMVSLVLLPLFLVGLVIMGLIKIAFPLLVIIGVISIFALQD